MSEFAFSSGDSNLAELSCRSPVSSAILLSNPVTDGSSPALAIPAGALIITQALEMARGDHDNSIAYPAGSRNAIAGDT